MGPIAQRCLILLMMTFVTCNAQQVPTERPKEPPVSTSTAPQKRPANRLKDATSPYLLQHAHNPVDWYPWGEEAFAKAKADDKPVFLSVGYSACHWCHVMERECFENEALAQLMNRHFVPVKVDREERPDLDDLYMRYVHLTGQGGGWPMSVFMTPDGEPFYAGTYFPPERFGHLLIALKEAWSGQREKVIQAALDASEGLRQHANAEYRQPDRPLTRETTIRAVELLDHHFDWTHGGLRAPRKFPPHPMLEWFLDRVARIEGDTAERRMVKLTLDRMQLGGIHDHIGGGFHRYSTDPEWFLPHFEKMLYDNAQLGRIYARASVALRDPAYAATARGIYDWVLRDMTSPDGVFYSSLDADSEGVEGRYYVWRAAEIRETLKTGATAFARLYNIDEKGNYHEEATGEETGKNIPFLSRGLNKEESDSSAAWRRALLDARGRRVRPHLDDKVLSGWNALMIGSLAEGGRLLKEPRYVQAAERAASWVVDHLRDRDGRWRTSFRAGRVSGVATLEDYAYLSAAFLDLHAATLDAKWVALARETVGQIDRHFRDAQRGGYFMVADDHEKLLTRVKNPADNATPSGNGILAQVFVRLAEEPGDSRSRERVVELLRTFHALLDHAPVQVESLLRAFDHALAAGWVTELLAAPPASASCLRRGRTHAELLLGQDRLVAGQSARIAVRLKVDDGYCVQGAEGAQGVTHPTRIRLVSDRLGALRDVDYPRPDRHTLSGFGDVAIYKGDLLMSGWLQVPEDTPPGSHRLQLGLDFQACGNETCEAPETLVLSTEVEVAPAGSKSKPLRPEVFPAR
jgi:uncharacterized protein YyaL (SSP411 family)